MLFSHRPSLGITRQFLILGKVRHKLYHCRHTAPCSPSQPQPEHMHKSSKASDDVTPQGKRSPRRRKGGDPGRGHEHEEEKSAGGGSMPRPSTLNKVCFDTNIKESSKVIKISNNKCVC